MMNKSTDQFQIHAFRLKPKQDLKKELIAFAQQKNLLASSVVAAVGSLSLASLRLASAQSSTHFPGPLEIVSLSGTLNKESCHLHISVAAQDGQVLGGHLLEGCFILTTCEVILLEDLTRVWTREHDPETGYLELKILNRNTADTTEPKIE